MKGVIPRNGGGAEKYLDICEGREGRLHLECLDFNIIQDFGMFVKHQVVTAAWTVS